MYLILVYGEVRVQLHSSACGCPIVLISFVEKTILSPSNDFGSFVKNHFAIVTWVFFCTLSYIPLIYMSVLTLVPHCLDYCIFVAM